MSAMTSTNKALMRRVYEEMWNRGNPAHAAELFAHREGVERFVSQFLGSFPDLQHTVEEMIAEGDRVAVRFTAHGTHTGPWLEFVPSGKAVQYSGVTLARSLGGKIVVPETRWDKAGLNEQIKG